MAGQECDYLIVGNSAAGLSAAEAIRGCDPDGSIIIVGEEPYPAYGRPLISYLVEGKTEEDRLWLRPSGFYEENGIQALLGPDYAVVGIDADRRRATLRNGSEVDYGACLLATGSVPFVPPIPGLEGASNVFPFMCLDDAKAARAAAVRVTDLAHGAARKSRVVVIGGGLIGLKAAEALSHHADEVVVLELAPRILPAVLDDEGAAVLQGLLEPHGITCLPGVSANEFIQDGSGAVIRAALTDGAALDCDLVVTAVGVRPNTALAEQAGARTERGIVCSPSMQTSLPHVYAAGDVVQVQDVLDGSKRPLALWPNAVRQGRCAGLNMAGSPQAEPFPGWFPINAVDFFDASLLTAGMINPDPDLGLETITRAADGTYAKFVMRDGALVGYILLNRPDNAGIYTSLIERGTPLREMQDGLLDGVPQNLSFSADARWERLHRGYPAQLDRRGWKEQVL